MADFSRIGRNNKNRGRNFERKVADFLGWTRVPYSGAIKDWGGGDVVDGFYKRKGLWSAECKTQQPGPLGTLSVLQKWLEQIARATSGGRQGILITRNVGERTIYVLMQAHAFDLILDNLMPSELDMMLPEPDLRAQGTGMGFVVPLDYLSCSRGLGYMVTFNVVSEKLDEKWQWVLMTLDTFKRYIDKYDLMEEDDAAPDA